MKQNWEYKKLGDVLSIVNGKNQKNVENSNGAYPIYGSGGIMGYANDYLCPENTIVIGRKGSINNPLYVTTKFWNVDTAFGLVSNQELLTPKYLYYFCCDYDFERLNKAVTIPSLTKSDLLQIGMNLPPLSTQTAIVSELDALSAIIADHKSLLKKYDELEQSIFYHMFGDPVKNDKGWEVKKLGEVASFKNGLNFNKSENGMCVKFLGVPDFQQNTEVYSEQLGTILIEDSIDEDYCLKDGDVVFVRSNGSKSLVGRNVLIHTNGEKVTFSGFCIRARIELSSFAPTFILYSLQVPSVKAMITNSGRGCNISNLNQKMLSVLPISTPPLPLQQAFASKIEAIEAMKADTKKSLAKSEELFNARMDYYFNA